MDALSFRNALREAKPTVESLAGIGIGKDETTEITASFDLRDRATEQGNNLSDSTLHDFFSRYDASSVEVGMVRFRDVPEPTSYGYIIGQVEADYLALEASSGEVTVRDITGSDHIIWKCARDGASLLAALATAAEYLSACMTINRAEAPLQRSTLNDCVRVAGGPLYRSFFEMLLGVE